MNWDRVEAEWKQVSGRFKQKWGKLTGSDLEQAEGIRDRLAGLLQKHYAIAKDEAEKQLDQFVSSLESGGGEGQEQAAGQPPGRSRPERKM